MTEPTEFDFKAHKISAEAEYRRVFPQYENFAKEVERILRVTLNVPSINIHEFQARAKTMDIPKSNWSAKKVRNFESLKDLVIFRKSEI
jgi:hypothetical protein